jgi:hypothetical protein
MSAYGKFTVKTEGVGNSKGRVQPVYRALTTRGTSSGHEESRRYERGDRGVAEGPQPVGSLFGGGRQNRLAGSPWAGGDRRDARTRQCGSARGVNRAKLCSGFCLSARQSGTSFRITSTISVYCGLERRRRPSAGRRDSRSLCEIEHRTKRRIAVAWGCRVSRRFLPKLGGPPRMAGPLFEAMPQDAGHLSVAPAPASGGSVVMNIPWPRPPWARWPAARP